MKVLLSGSNGSFGSELIKHLSSFDIDTISLRYGSDNEQQMSKLADCDVFIHCSALINGKFNDLFESNLLLTKNIVDYLSVKNQNVHFIYFSSMSILRKKPQVSVYDYLDFRDMSDYALSKYLTEIMCSRNKNTLPNITVVRFSTLFHKDPARDGLSKLVYDAVKNRKITIYNGGVAKRDFIPLDIAAGYIEKLLLKEEFFGETLNIVSGKEVNFKEVADFLGSKIVNLAIEDKKDPKIVDNVPSDFSCASIKKLKETPFDLTERILLYIKELQL